MYLYFNVYCKKKIVKVLVMKCRHHIVIPNMNAMFNLWINDKKNELNNF